MPGMEDLNQRLLEELHPKRDQDQRDLKQNHQRKDQRRDPKNHLRKEERPRKAPGQSLLNLKLRDLKEPKDLKRAQDLQAADLSPKADPREHTNKKQPSINSNMVKSQSTWSSTTTSHRI